MTPPVALDAMTEDQLLDHADTCAVTAQRAEVDLLRVAYQWAVVHHAQRLDPGETGKPGRERVKQYGGPGTTPVTEFAAAGLGARIGRSPYAAARLIGDAQDLAHRHPQLWGRVQALEVRASYARHVATRTRDLSATEAGYVDAAVAESADGRIPWSRFETLVDAKVAAAAPAAHRAKEEKARQARFAKVCGTTTHGMGSFLVRADTATITSINTLVTAVAAALKTAMPEVPTDERRLHALLLLLHQKATPTGAAAAARDAEPDPADAATAACTPPWEREDERSPEPSDEAPAPDDAVVAAGKELANIDLADLLPTVQLFVHLYYGTGGPGARPGPGRPDSEVDPETGDQEPIARLEGHGPVTATWVRDVLGATCRFKVTPVIDLVGQAPVDAYEIPDRHRTAVHLITPADVFPHAASLSRTKQIDHTIPWDPNGPPGQSGLGNYGPMTTGHHRTQDPQQLAGPTALPRHLRLARPPRGVPPRRPHRDQTPPPPHRTTTRHRDLPPQHPDEHRTRRPHRRRLTPPLALAHALTAAGGPGVQCQARRVRMGDGPVGGRFAGHG